MFLSLRKHVRHWSNPLGRYFFQSERDDRTTPVWRAPEGTITAPVDGGGAWPGNTQTQAPPDWRPPRGLRGMAAVPVGSGRTGRTTRRRIQPHTATRRHRCEGRRRDRRARLRCPWAVAGPGRASRRRAEPKARGADGSRAGRRPRAHKAARPSRTARPAPRTPAEPQATTRGATSSTARTRAEGNPYSPRNALIAGISRTACTRPAR